MVKIEPDDFYQQYYEKIFNNGLISRFSNFMHYFIERPRKNKYFEEILEVGSGHGQHFNFVKSKYHRYTELDLRVLENSTVGSRNRVSLQGDAQNLINIRSNSIDRLIATCLIAHLPDPDKAVSEWRRVVKAGGVLDIYVPCEPGMMLRIFRAFTTVPKSEKLGLDHKSMHYREHRNSWILCNIVISECFSDDKVKIEKFPFGLPSWNFRLFDIYRIVVKK
jgi:ubiquinone/menaquinone biosynthesis C-methylase UbiE